MIGVGQEFPYFVKNGVDYVNAMCEVAYDDFNGWKVYYFYPKDFTFICPTEIKGMDMLTPEATVVGFSGDNEFCKLAWKENNELIKHIQHTLACDSGLELSKTLGIYDKLNGVCYRATYIVDPDGIIAHMSVNRDDTGRNASEVLRTLQALKAGGLTGCEWQPGEDFVA